MARPQSVLEGKDYCSRYVIREIAELMINRYPWPRGYVLAILFTCILGLSHQLPAQQVEQAPPPAAPQNPNQTRD